MKNLTNVRVSAYLRRLSLASARGVLGAFVLIWGVAAASAVESPELTSEQMQFFENKIRPILANSCLECHSAEKGKVKGGFNMDTRLDMLKGGENGSVLKPGDSKGSTFIKAIEWGEDLQMPPKKKLSDQEIEVLKKWVDIGAPDPREGSTGEKVSKKDHWAFQPVKRPTAPEVKNVSWCKSPIDKFVLAKLEEKEMLPADPTDTGTDEDKRTKREALLRRAYFDLIGLPPSPREIQDFTNDKSPDAFEKVIDRLLASPAYGERWARHWMDTARYSDTTGYLAEVPSFDFRYAYAWAYRDWLIKSINKDMPYDQFILNQLAADKLPGNDPNNLAALGFLTVGQRFQDKNDEINDRIDAVGRGFLGLTVACARCHDHKFDPVTMADYYALRGVFASTVEPKVGPMIGGNPDAESFKKYSEKLSAMEKKATYGFVQMQRQFSQMFRLAPAAYIEAAYQSKKETPEGRKRADALVDKFKLDAGNTGLLESFVVRMKLKDPVMGPFLAIAESASTPSETLERLRREIARSEGKVPPYNPVVMEFLSKAGNLPTDLAGLSELFAKMIREKVEPVAGAPMPLPHNFRKEDAIQELEKAGIYRKIVDPSTTPETPDYAVMELAVFPKALVVGSEMAPGKEITVPRIQEEVKHWGVRGRGPELEQRAHLSAINELMMTTKGGPVRAMVLEDHPSPQNSAIFPRGNAPKGRKDELTFVPRRFIEVLAGEGGAEPFVEGSGRYELARAIASKSNPLTARVMVNRIWYYHFGEGLVRTPDDLGNQAGAPSHPELLDFLSAWFTDDYGQGKPGWSVKMLHKAIMMSNVYQQSSKTLHLARQQEMDAGNRLLWRSNLRRLDFEAFRDSLLSMGNMMDRTMFGPPVNIVSEPYSYRRSVYGYLDRSDIPDLLSQFDMVNSVEPNTKRTTTIVPQQALFLLNSPFVVSVAKQVVRRPEVVEAVAQRKDMRAGIITIFQIVLQRTPNKSEFDMAVDFLQRQAKMQPEVVQAVQPGLAAAAKQAASSIERLRMSEARNKPVVNEGTILERTPLTPWETLVQALMFCNEATYLN